MRIPIRLVIMMIALLTPTVGHTQVPPPVARPDGSSLPPPGTRGNADNVPFIGRRDPGNNPVRLARATGHVSNYDEKKVSSYTLPDPLVMANGERVDSAEKWFKVRRPEILEFYQTEIYGRIPSNAPRVTWEVIETDSKARDGAAIRKRVVGRMGNKPDAPRMNLTMFLPARANGPIPMLLSISFGFGAGGRGQIAAPKKGEGAAKPTLPPRGFDAIGEVLSRGWGYTTLNYTDIQPDRADRWTEGVIGLTLKPGQARPAPDEWGTISAWAWGISRSIDYLETDRAVNPKQIAITGVSRLGKTVLWAGAGRARGGRVLGGFRRDGRGLDPPRLGRDPRRHGTELPLAVCRQPPEVGRQVERFARGSAHADRPVAPRPVYVNGGLIDQWSDPKGEFLAVTAAGPVYRLLGRKDLGVTELPPLDTPITSGDLAFHYHSGGHMAVPADWKAFLDFADRHIRASEGEIAVRLALSTVMLPAADPWAAARRAGLPVAAPEALDGGGRPSRSARGYESCQGSPG